MLVPSEDRRRRRPHVAAWANALVAIAALIAPIGAAAQSPAPDSAPRALELSLSTATGTAYSRGKAGARWAELLTAAAGGRMVIRHVPGAALSARDPSLEFRVLQNGPAQLAVGSALQWSSDVPAFGVFALPWFAATPRALEALASDRALAALLAARAEAAGVVIVAIGPLGHHVVATVRGPVVTPADYSGLRLRALALPIVVDTFAALGAIAAATTLAAAQTEIAAGRLDGQDGRAAAFAATRIAIFGQTQVTVPGAFGDAMIFAIRRSLWDTWDGALRDAARDTAIRAAAEADAAARDEAALAQLAKSGVTITRLSAAGRRALREATRPVFERYIEIVGRDVVDAAKAALDAIPEAER